MILINNILKERFLNKLLKFIKTKYKIIKLCRYKHIFHHHKTYLYFLDNVTYVYYLFNGHDNMRLKSKYFTVYYNRNIRNIYSDERLSFYTKNINE